MNINEILKGLDSSKLQQLINRLSSDEKAAILKKLDSLSDSDIKKIINGR